jgi:hypothetical protein
MGCILYRHLSRCSMETLNLPPTRTGYTGCLEIHIAMNPHTAQKRDDSIWIATDDKVLHPNTATSWKRARNTVELSIADPHTCKPMIWHSSRQYKEAEKDQEGPHKTLLLHGEGSPRHGQNSG